MQRLVYRPKVWAYVKGSGGGSPVDLSPYIVKGKVSRVVNDASKASLTIRNPDFKFTTPGNPTFRPMDPITIFMARNVSRPVRVFTGFLDDTGYMQLFPGTITLTASCTIKRLKYTYWDPALPFTKYFMMKYNWIQDEDGRTLNMGATVEEPIIKTNYSGTVKFKDIEGQLNDSGLSNILAAIMQAVGNWSPEDLLIEPLPPTLLDEIDRLWDGLKTERKETRDALKAFLKKAIGDPPKEVATSVYDNNVPSSGTQEGKLNKRELVALARKHNFPDPNLAAAVALAESGGEIGQISHNPSPPSDDLGLWQINDRSHPDWAGTEGVGSNQPGRSGSKRRRLTTEPDYNARAAYAISNGGKSWSPWVAYTNGNYRQFL